MLPKIESAEQRAKLRHHFDLLYRGEIDPVRMRDDIVPPLENPGAAFAQLRESPGLVLGTLGRAWVANFGMQFFSQPYGGFDLVFLRKSTPVLPRAVVLRVCTGDWRDGHRGVEARRRRPRRRPCARARH